MTAKQEIEKAKKYAILKHGSQKYGSYPYIYHLEKVANHLVPFGTKAQVIGYLHDVVEDTDTTLANIAEEFGMFIEMCIEILTDAPGKNRKERKKNTYIKFDSVKGRLELALIVKTADRLANIENSISERDKNYLSMYRKEHVGFRAAVYREGLCDDLWHKMETMLKNGFKHYVRHPDRIITLRCWNCVAEMETTEGDLKEGDNKLICSECGSITILAMPYLWDTDEEPKLYAEQKV